MCPRVFLDNLCTSTEACPQPEKPSLEENNVVYVKVSKELCLQPEKPLDEKKYFEKQLDEKMFYYEKFKTDSLSGTSIS